MIGMFKTSSARACLFLHVRTHSQLQYYLKLNNTRRAANDGGSRLRGAHRLGNVVQIHSMSRGSRS